MKYALIAALVATAAGAGFYGGYRMRPPAEVQVQTVTQIEERERVVTKVVKVTEQQKAPDGTVVEKTTETTTATTDKQVASEGTVPVPDVVSYRPDWSVNANWNVRLDGAESRPDTVDVGRRVLGNAWLMVGYDLGRRAPRVGVRLDF